MRSLIIVYWCDFCGYEFGLFKAFPDDITPYCPNCANDHDVLPTKECEVIGS